ncbi:hypothetical protein MWU75_17615 [Ornithinimicrobium sp. F0845]|uniref:hypothetical protein n=1 Tax=Ornithinimicrobium sp. F0845 TaxID=2926412 RepID=UPI001FF49067|nr:hypothetical protein [Ornithinimicrobium sp. F0845]MCK0113963.1 hypothetical protein [Ornithinimicrobium sp. F0845]
MHHDVDQRRRGARVGLVISWRRALTEQLLAQLGALAAISLRLGEEVDELLVAVALGVGAVLLHAQRVAQAGLDEPGGASPFPG